jgi:hypothetical protein
LAGAGFASIYGSCKLFYLAGGRDIDIFLDTMLDLPFIIEKKASMHSGD